MRNGLAPILFNRPGWVPYGASLAFDFTRGRGWTPNAVRPAAGMLTTTRASDAYADSNSGFWQAFTSGQPRITDRGLLVEESRTNSIRNNSMQGAVAGTPGTAPTNWSPGASGLTIQLVGTGTENGIDYIDYRFSGTTSATFGQILLDTTTGIAATNGQTWSGSFFAKLVAGSMTNVTSMVMNISQRDSGGASLSAVTLIADMKGSLSSVLTRFSGAAATNNASTAYVAPLLGWAWSSGVAVDFTLRIGWPQLELGAFATSPIRTTSAAATRAADAITTALAGTSEGAVVAYGRTAPGSVSGTNQPLWVWDDGTVNNRMLVYRDGATKRMYFFVISGGVNQAQIDLGVVGDSTAFKVGVSWKANDFVAVINGGSPGTDVSGSVPTGLTTFRHGGGGIASSWNSTISREAIFPAYLSGSQLQALTA